MCLMTSHLHFSPCTPIHAGTGCALRATMECSRGTTSDEEDVEDEGDMPPSLEGEDDEDEGNVTSGVADCAAAVRRERVESGTPMTCKKVARTNFMGKPSFYSILPLP